MRFHKWINVFLFIAAMVLLGDALGDQLMMMQEHGKTRIPKINVVENHSGINIPFAAPPQIAPTVNHLGDPIH